MKIACSSLFMFALSSICTVAFAQNAQSIALGKAKAEQACVMCHGADGISKMPNVPHLAGQPEIYMVEQMKALRSGKRHSETMGFIAKPLSDDDIVNLSAWYSSIEIKATVKP
jgi:cytochrome c553